MLTFLSSRCSQGKEEFDNVLKAHKAYVKNRFPSYNGSGQDAYADAGDLGVDSASPEAQALKKPNASNGHANGAAKGTNGMSNGKTNGALPPKPTVSVA